VWQDLHAELHDRGLTIIAVALDSDPEAARPWVEAAAPAYPVPIDPDHEVAALYNLVNVPQAVWIDEAGLIVRPPETAGAYDTVRNRDPVTLELAPGVAEWAAATRQAYHDAVRDWVANGPDSRFVLSAAAARARMPAVTPEIARAHVLFRLGQHLLRRGRTDEAERHLAEASRLHPESWAIWRQAAGKNATGLAAGPDFWERVRAHGDRPYYPPPDMPGLP
jgi:hypothetical protein